MVAKVKSLLYLCFILSLPLNRPLAMWLYLTAALLNAATIRRRNFSWL
jgi:hypothetical protein